MAHWKNSHFQTEYFIAGQCHTADEAYRVLRQQREDRAVAVANFQATNLRTEAKILRAKSVIDNPESDPAAVLEAKADLAEVEAFAAQAKAVYDVAVAEIAHMDRLIEKLQPLRKYAHLSDEEADQVCQREEWGLRLAHRAKMFLFSQGSIPSDQLETMMSHPDFKTLIAPQIKAIADMAEGGKLSFDAVEKPALLEVAK